MPGMPPLTRNDQISSKLCGPSKWASFIHTQHVGKATSPLPDIILLTSTEEGGGNPLQWGSSCHVKKLEAMASLAFSSFEEQKKKGRKVGRGKRTPSASSHR
jgi:hypothetical protein